MNINYTDHALERMGQRGISKCEVEKTIRQGRKVDADNGLRRSVLKAGSGILVVIFAIGNSGAIEVVTTYRQ